MNLKVIEKDKTSEQEEPSLLNYFHLAKQKITLKNKNIEKESDLVPGNAPIEGAGFAFKRLKVQKNPDKTIDQMIKMKRKKIIKSP